MEESKQTKDGQTWEIYIGGGLPVSWNFSRFRAKEPSHVDADKPRKKGTCA